MCAVLARCRSCRTTTWGAVEENHLQVCLLPGMSGNGSSEEVGAAVGSAPPISFVERDMFETNQNTPERILRFLVALVLLPAPFVMEQSTYSLIAAGVGAILLFNALSGTCMTYKMFGVNTCALPEKES